MFFTKSYYTIIFIIIFIHITVSIYRKDGSFNVDNVRVSKILGAGMHASEVIRGMVFVREAEGDVRKVENAKIAVFSCALDSETTETKVS